MKLKNLLLILLILPLLLNIKVDQTYCFEKVGTTSFQFLKINPDARAMAMAEAFTTVGNSSSSLFWNPAAIVAVENLDVSFSRVNWLVDTYVSAVTGAYTIQGFGTIGIQWVQTNIGDIDVTRVENLGFQGDSYNPGLTGEKIYPSAMTAGLSFSRAITDKFTFGATSKFIEEDLIMSKTNTLAFDMGFTYQTGFKSFMIGGVVRNFGPEVQFEEESFPIPQTFIVGASAALLAPGQQGFLGASEDHTFIVAYDLQHPRDYTQQHNMGFEYGLHDMLFLRGGYRINYDTATFSGGLGFKAAMLNIDYSYSNFGEYFSPVHQFTLRLWI
jgi:hypothetical protein